MRSRVLRRPSSTTGRAPCRRTGAPRSLWVATAALIALATVVVPARPAEAAGMTTHSWMAVTAIDQVADANLRTLLQQHVEQVRAGATLPDIGYVGSNTYGEEMHWQRYIDAYAERIRTQPGCTDLTDPDGPCAEMVAHLMGVAAHGMGDEVWDWLFEPYGPDLDEYYTNPAVSFFNESGAESQMDVVAVGRFGAPRPTMPPIPALPLVLGAFSDVGRGDVTSSQFDIAAAPALVWDVENSWVPTYLASIEAAMPWMAANMVTAPGGVDFAATAIAGYWGDLWVGLRGGSPTSSVSITYPASDQQGIPATGWERAFQPGSSRGRGGARNRITAVLTTARPYQTPGGPSVSNQLPVGTMTITERDTATPIALMAGYPRSVPYGADSGEHLIDVQPAHDLAPCTWYRVDVGATTPVADAHGGTVAAHHWDFRTDDGSGGPCETAAITGKVTGPSGEGVADVSVLAYEAHDGFAPTALVTTAPDGTYTLPDLPDGAYRLYFRATDTSLAPQWAGGVAGRWAGPARVVPGGPESVDAHLVVVGAVTGTIHTSTGTPVVGATVWAVSPHDTWVPTGWTTTGGDGRFSFVGLPPETYRFVAAAPGGPATWYAGASSRATATPVTVSTTAVDLTLTLTTP